MRERGRLWEKTREAIGDFFNHETHELNENGGCGVRPDEFVE